MDTLMTKLERFKAAVAHERVDRLPVTVWMHLGTEHLSGDEAAVLYAKYAKEYDWDFLKVMNDYRLPLPEGVVSFETGADLSKFERMPMDARPFREQMLLLNDLQRLMGPDFPLVETVFSPVQVLMRAGGMGALNAIVANPDEGLAALEIVTEMMCEYVGRLAETGVAGIYFSVDGAGRVEEGGLELDIFERFVKPFDVRVLEAAEGFERIVHIHGYGIEYERVQDYPSEVWSWSHDHTGPTFTEMRRNSSAAIMGGINRERFSRLTALEVEAGIRAAAEEAGTRGLLIAPGCTSPPDTPRHLLHHAVATARSIAID